MRRVLTAVSDIAQLVIFLAVSVIAAADLLQLLDLGTVYGEKWPLQVAKITMLVVGLIGAAQVVERRLHLLDIQDRVDAVAKEVGALRATAGPGAAFAATRADLYRAFEDALKQLPSGAQVLVTHFEKLQSVPYDTGEIREERELMETWDRRVAQKDFFVEQIVHVSSRRDLQEVKDRIAKFREVPTYLVNVMIGPPVSPYVEVVVLGESWAMLGFSSDAVSPRVTDVGFCFSADPMVPFLAQYFRIWWSKFSIPVKTRDGVNEELIQALEKRLPPDDDEERIAGAFDLAMQMGCDPWLEKEVKQLVSEYESVKALEEGVFLDKARQSIARCGNELKQTGKGVIMMGPEGILELLSVIRKAQKHIAATSYIDNAHFWDTSTGKHILQAKGDAVRRGVAVTQVFILSAEEMLMPTVLKGMQEHRNSGVEVLVVDAAELSADLRQDFLIEDQKLVFRNEEDANGIRTNTVLIDPKEVEAAKRAFDLIMVRTKCFGEWFGSTEKHKPATR
jgi:hypothetical protein